MVFSDKLFSDEALADTPVSDNEVPVLAVRVPTDEGVPLVLPVIDQIVRRNKDRSVFEDKWMGKVSVLSIQIWDPPIHSGTWDVELSHADTEWLCLLYSAGSGSVGNGTMAIGLDDQSLDHWRGTVWDPGLCLMALLHEVVLLLHNWAKWAFWTRTESGNCRSIDWELGYLGSITPPCDVDRLSHQNAWQIKELKVVVMTNKYNNNRLQRCACVRDTSLGVLSAGRISIMVIGQIGCGAALWVALIG